MSSGCGHGGSRFAFSAGLQHVRKGSLLARGGDTRIVFFYEKPEAETLA